jgi:hypothetical protein
VLTKTFYLIDTLPGRYDNGSIWVTKRSSPDRKNNAVSSVIIGNHDWATAWAADSNDISYLSGGLRQQEMAIRSGINFVMYALTGNYKSDQVHLPHILERLGQ